MTTETTPAEVPMSDRIARFMEHAADGWRIRARRPDGLASSSFGADFGPALAEAFRRASAEPAGAVTQWQGYDNRGERKWINIDPDEIEEWKRLGYPVRALYASPSPSPVVSEEMVERFLDKLLHGLEIKDDHEPQFLRYTKEYLRVRVRDALTASLSLAPAGEAQR